ncbi:AI-2E family transporter [Xaviernesmea oryzae]|uniref:AI-2E family transporter n=1 Tax=Xaviernesmea oryzae TaxID=464029 RepID=UPI0008D74CD7|nr:AI-2E family transporter [Xaviernesmea oryzae]SEK60101.1 Predicted PurR-regulated permease PerM [Xaviernesmea oryzae]
MTEVKQQGQVFKRHAIFWGAVLAIFIVFLFLFRSILLPFFAGMALAYFLDPVADRLERWGLSRMMATIVILVSFLVIFVLSLIVILPIVFTQAGDFIVKIPDYVVTLQTMLTSPDSHWMPDWIAAELPDIRQNSVRLLQQAAGFLATLIQQLWNSGLALLDILSLFIVTPVVAFYLLLDWDRMVAKVDSWIPRQHLMTVRSLAREIDLSIAGFVRGQGSLCLILGLYYGVLLSISGLNFGLLIGLFAGMISFVPYVGSMVGLVLAVGVALVQFWPDYVWVAVIACIFFSGQFLEGNILQPKLVGSSVGLHPVWLMFALLAFGVLFGFVGLLVAVPLAAAIGVLVRFALSRYLDSALYHGPPKTIGAPHGGFLIEPDLDFRKKGD